MGIPETICKGITFKSFGSWIGNGNRVEVEIDIICPVTDSSTALCQVVFEHYFGYPGVTFLAGGTISVSSAGSS